MQQVTERKGIAIIPRQIHVMGVYATRNSLDIVCPPLDKLIPIAHLEHARSWSFYSHVNVWTHNGWLITAIQEDGVTCHVRRGNEAGRIYLDPNTRVWATKRCPPEQRYLGLIDFNEQVRLLIDAVVTVASFTAVGQSSVS